MIEPLLSTGPPTPRNFFAKSLMTNAAIEPNRWDSMFGYLGSAGVNASVSWWFETISKHQSTFTSQFDIDHTHSLI
jgi:hypothetical protein